MSYKIIGDSCCDWTDGSDELDFITRVPLSIELGNKTYTDDETLDCKELLDAMDSTPTAPKSACPSPGVYADAFSGADDIYAVTLSSKLSGSFASAEMGAMLAKEETPNAHIHVFDSHSAAAGEILICLKLRELTALGLPFAEVVRRTQEFIGTMSTFFTLETLEVFRKNGRLNHLQSIATAALKIKLVMRETDGNVAMADKALTMDGALSRMVKHIQKAAEKLDCTTRTLVITQCACPERAEKLRGMIEKVCSFRRILICRSGGISTMYANRGGVIVSF